jgi:small-conductance mechanosensitive channel
MLKDLAQDGAIFLLALALCLAVRHLGLRALKRGIREPGSASEAALRALRFPSVLWSLAASLTFTIKVASLRGPTAKWAAAGAFIFLILSICVVASTLLVRIAMLAGQRRGLRFGLSGVSKALIHVFVLLLGVSVILRYFDITIAPLLTALGVGGLAVALALRDTLANFFAGIHIVVEEPISIGNFIQLSSGEEGTVIDIGWRTTRVQTTTNNIIVIPNEKITSSILTNYALPDPRVVTNVALIAGFDADPARVVEIAMEEARLVEGALPEFTPVVLFDPGVQPTHLQWKVIVQVADRLQVGMVQSRLRTRLHERFRRENIPMPSLEHVAMFKA